SLSLREIRASQARSPSSFDKSFSVSQSTRPLFSMRIGSTGIRTPLRRLLVSAKFNFLDESISKVMLHLDGKTRTLDLLPSVRLRIMPSRKLQRVSSEESEVLSSSKV